MSSGFFGFFAHAGVLAALEDAGLRPSRASGSSAGALVAGAHASGVPAAGLVAELVALEREHFWDPGPFYGAFQGGLLSGRLFHRRLESMLPARTFEGCRVPVTVSAFDVLARRTTVLDRGELASAILASCAVPGLFRPVHREGRWLLDGGIRDRPGIAGLPPHGRVPFHHLASRPPWRRAHAPELPRRPRPLPPLRAPLPRVGPDRLAEGRVAMSLAREATTRALSSPVVDATVRCTAA